MTGDVGTVAGTLGQTVLWSSLGGGELIMALIVGLVLLAFAFPARLGAGETERRKAAPGRSRLSHR